MPLSVHAASFAYATSVERLLATFDAIARDVLGDRARPLNDRDLENADDLLDAFSLDEVLPLLRDYFACEDDVLRDQAYSFTYFCAYVHVTAGNAQDVADDLLSVTA